MMENSLTVLIVEDDLSFAIELDILVKEIGYKVLGRADNSEDALGIILSESPDLILMDNDINGQKTGIELAEQIKHLSTPILFITSFGQTEYYERAKQTNFIGYLVKPIDKLSLRSSIELAIQNLEQSRLMENNGTLSNSRNLYFKKKGIYIKVAIEDILFVQADDDYTLTFTEKDSFTSSIRLNELEELLASDTTFLRIHRSYIVNLSKVNSVDPDNNKVYIGEHCIPFSRRTKSDLLKNMYLLK